MIVVRQLLDLVLPRSCAGCGRSWSPGALCPTCVPATAAIRADVLLPVEVVAAAAYEGPLRAAVLRYKERGRRELTGVLATLLARSVRALAAWDESQPLVLVPVPSARAAATARGGDHVLRLAHRAARELGVPVAAPLRLVRAVRDSAGLGAAERERDRRESMRARPPAAHLARRRVVIVDDIVTTGATLHEATRALQASGWAVTGCSVLASTARSRPPRAAGAISGPRGQPGSAKSVAPVDRASLAHRQF